MKELFGPHKIVDGSIIVLSPSDGIINYMFDGEKELPLGESLLRIQNSDNSFYAVGFANSANISKIRQGSQVYMKIEAFPFAEYGVIKGIVKNINMATDLKGNYAYHIEIIKDDLKRFAFVQGMEGSATVHIEKKSFWRHVFEKVRYSFGRVDLSR